MKKWERWEDFVRNELNKRNISRNSYFYNYIRNRMLFHANISELRQKIESDGVDISSGLYRDIEQIIGFNSQMLKTRIEHYKILKSIKKEGELRFIRNSDGNYYKNALRADVRELQSLEKVNSMIERKRYNKIIGIVPNLRESVEEQMTNSGYVYDLSYEQHRKDLEKPKTWKNKTKETIKDFTKKVAIVTVAGLVIAGINHHMTLARRKDTFDVVAKPVAVEKEIIEGQNPEAVYKVTMPSISIDTSMQSPTVKQKGSLASTVQNMDDGLVHTLATALRKSNREVPTNRFVAYGIAREYELEDDRIFLKKALAELDERASSLQNGDKYSIAYPMRALAESYIKYVVADTVNSSESYKKDVSMSDVDIYFSYNSNDTVRSYDVRTVRERNGRLEQDTLIGRRDHFESNKLGSLIENYGQLDRAMSVCAVGDQNYYIYKSSQELYNLFGKFIRGDIELEADSPGKGIKAVEEIER